MKYQRSLKMRGVLKIKDLLPVLGTHTEGIDIKNKDAEFWATLY